MNTPRLILSSILACLLLAAAAAPAAADAAAYRNYVACGLNAKSTPSHSCARGAKKGAFFRSTQRDVRYTICLRVPRGRSLCAKGQEARQGTLYVNKITSLVPGKHRITWFVEGKRVGRYFFRVARR